MIKIKNIYYLIAGVLAVLFAITHGWNGHATVLTMSEVQEMSIDTQVIFTYVWHIITAENLIFGIAFFFMAFQNERSGVQFAAWMIVAILIIRLMVILGVTILLNISGLTDMFIDSIAIVIYIALISVGTIMKGKGSSGQQMQEQI